VGPRAGLDTEARGKILCPCRGSNPNRPIIIIIINNYIGTFGFKYAKSRKKQNYMAL
jgi:hypothetical protein